MQQETLQQVVAELESTLTGRFVGRVFQLSPLSFAIDFGVRNEGYLFVSAEPAQPRLYLIKRSTRELEKQSSSPSHFLQAFQHLLNGSRLVNVTRDESERIVRLEFLVENEIGERRVIHLVCQLTGRSANLFLLDENELIRHALRPPKGEGQQPGQSYQPPTPQPGPAHPESQAFNYDRKSFSSVSQALDAYYTSLEDSQSFDRRAQLVNERLKKELAQRKKLKRNLERDLAEHGDPEQHKRLGDLLLANISTAVRSGNKVTLKDYYAAEAPEISLELDEDASLQEEAARYFGRYSKAKRAAQEISARLAKIESELFDLEKRRQEIEKIVETRDEAGLSKYDEPAVKSDRKSRGKQEEKIPGVRRYLSSDQYEILVGRAALTNDKLTFKVARPHDLWLHAADYPGSHVVIRNPSRKEIPHRTIVEAAQLAAKFSQAGDDSKVTVHYTSRQFLAKPKGAAPGLVRMSSFKTVNVAPGEPIPRIKNSL